MAERMVGPGPWRVLAGEWSGDAGVVGALARSLQSACDLLEAPRVWLDVGDADSPAWRCVVHGITFMGNGRCRYGTSGPGDCSRGLKPNFGSVTRLVDKYTGEIAELGRVVAPGFVTVASVVSAAEVVARAREFMAHCHTTEIELDPTGIGMAIAGELERAGCHVVRRGVGYHAMT